MLPVVPNDLVREALKETLHFADLIESNTAMPSMFCEAPTGKVVQKEWRCHSMNFKVYVGV